MESSKGSVRGASPFVATGREGRCGRENNGISSCAAALPPAPALALESTRVGRCCALGVLVWAGVVP